MLSLVKIGGGLPRRGLKWQKSGLSRERLRLLKDITYGGEIGFKLSLFSRKSSTGKLVAPNRR